jgi:phosphoglycolate phosphatase
LIKLCVFDLDGTLVNSLEDLAHSTNYALQNQGFPIREVEEYRDFLGEGLHGLLQCAAGENFTEEIGLCLVDDFNAYYSAHYADNTLPYDGMPDLLNDLQARDIMLAVLSNKPDNFAKNIVQKMYPRAAFAMVQGKTDKFPQKPDPASLINILAELNILTAETLYIGDSNIDVFTAHRAGVKVAGVAWGFRGKYELVEAGADYIVESPPEILQLV